MSEKIALIGFVNTEEVLADKIKQQTPDVQVDGYELFPNEAFGRTVDNRYPLYDFDDTGLIDTSARELKRLQAESYAAVNLGPDTAIQMLSGTLDELGVAHVGSSPSELEIETDKTNISKIFSDATGVLPRTAVVEASDLRNIDAIIEELGGIVVAKFVGDYTEYFDDSEYRRVRLPSEFESPDELVDFIRKSIDASGHAVLQQHVVGQQFSYTCLTDHSGAIFPLGENVFYKNRFEGDAGPFFDGAGSISINNTLPGLLSPNDRAQIETRIVQPYLEKLDQLFGRKLRSFLNIDLIKSADGQIYLLEVNNRQAGGHTMSTLLAGLETPLASVLQAAQEDRLAELQPRFKEGASVAVTIFPEIAPADFANDDDRPIITIPKLKPGDPVRHYTGWVDVVDENEDETTVQSNLTATLIVNTHAPTVAAARAAVYERVHKLVAPSFAFRGDIAVEYLI